MRVNRQKLFLDFLQNKIAVKMAGVYLPDSYTDTPADKEFYIPEISNKMGFFNFITDGRINQIDNGYHGSYASAWYFDLKYIETDSTMTESDNLLLELYKDVKKSVKWNIQNKMYEFLMMLLNNYVKDNFFDTLINDHQKYGFDSDTIEFCTNESNEEKYSVLFEKISCDKIELVTALSKLDIIPENLVRNYLSNLNWHKEKITIIPEPKEVLTVNEVIVTAVVVEVIAPAVVVEEIKPVITFNNAYPAQLRIDSTQELIKKPAYQMSMF